MTYKNEDSPQLGSNSDGLGGEVQGGKTKPCNLDPSSKIIFSRVVRGLLASDFFGLEPRPSSRAIIGFSPLMALPEGWHLLTR